MIPTFACVLKMGGDYLPGHVQALAKQVKQYTSIPYRFVCYSDIEIEGIKTIPLINNYPGWWSVPEVFRNIGPTVITGIDTVIKGNLDPLFKIALESSPQDFWMIKGFNPRNKYASGIMAHNSDFSDIYKNFTYPDSIKGLQGEQDYTIKYLLDNGIVPKILNNKLSGIYSYKKQCRINIPRDARVILFHGKPRPFEIPKIWDNI